MSALFISHASADADTARDLATRLEEWGYGSLFLDFDPEHGIRAGVAWEAELYRRLKLARAVIAVVSRSFLDSRWCFAEVTQARSLGKPVFPLRIEDCELGSLLEDRQAVDLTRGEEEGYDCLRRGLEVVIGGDLPFDRDRPYPGLASFEAEDAGVFFGREEEQAAVIEALERMRRRGDPRLAVVLGASGSGKSSLVKAGVLPRLARDRDRWLVVPPMRPGDRPDLALARAFAAAFETAGVERGWREVASRLAEESAGRHPWSALAEDLREASGRRRAFVLLAIDQMEGLLAPHAGETAQHHAEFRSRLRAALDDADGPIVAVATLRSDFLGLFHFAPELRGLAFETLPLGPMPKTRLDRVIVGPAERAGVEIEEKLVRRLLADTGSDDALPLLAYTLRELWESRDGGALTETVYEDRLGSIEGAIARIAEGIGGRGDAAEQYALRSALLRMVRLDDEGRFVRRTARWEEIPEAARALVERYVDEHLLVSDTVEGERRIEVAHEALFRAWTRLANWLDEERELLLFRQRLGRARGEWVRLGEDSSALLDGAALAEAERWANDRPDDLDPQELEFVQRSVERRERERRAAVRRRRRTIAVRAAGVAIAAGLAALALWQWRRAEIERRQVVARELAIVAAASDLSDDDETDETVKRLLLATESMRSGWTREGYAAWMGAVPRLLPGPDRKLDVGGRVTGLAVHPSEYWVAVADLREGVRVFDIDTGREVATLEHPKEAHALTFSPDGRWLAAGKAERITVWQTAGWRLAQEIEGTGHTHDIAFSADGEFLAAAQQEAVLWPVSTRTWKLSRPHEREPGDHAVAIAFSPDSLELAVGGERSIEVHRRADASSEWPTAARLPSESIRSRVCRPGDEVRESEWCQDTAWPRAYLRRSLWDRRGWRLVQGPGAHSLNRRWAARIEGSGDVELLNVRGRHPPARLAGSGDVESVVFSADARWLITGGRNLEIWSRAQIWRVGATRRLRGNQFRSAAFSPDGSWFAACDSERVRLFSIATWASAAEFARPCFQLGFAGDGRLAVRNDGVDIFEHDRGEWRNVASIAGLPRISSLALSPDQRWALVHQLYEFNPRPPELVRPSRTSVLDLATGEEVAWRTNETADVEAILRGNEYTFQGLPRNQLAVRWESPEGADVQIGAAGRLDLLERTADWQPVEFEGEPTSPDGRWLVDGLAGALLEPRKKRPIVGLRSEPRAVAFSPDLGHGSEWIAIAEGPDLLLWRLGPVEALVEETCARVSRNLTPEEWPFDGPPPVTCPGR